MIYVGEFSFSQGCYNVTTLENAIQFNSRAVIANRPIDYIPVCWASSYTEASLACDQIKKAREGTGKASHD